jgi:hypothetical protein
VAPNVTAAAAAKTKYRMFNSLHWFSWPDVNVASDGLLRGNRAKRSKFVYFRQLDWNKAIK